MMIPALVRLWPLDVNMDHGAFAQVVCSSLFLVVICVETGSLAYSAYTIPISIRHPSAVITALAGVAYCTCNLALQIQHQAHAVGAR